jgi:hypothetical protein
MTIFPIEVPSSLRSSCLALVAEQEIRSNPPTLSAHPSPNKKRLLDQVSYIHGLHAISTSQQQSAAGQLTQAYFESKHQLESSFDLPNTKFEPTVPSSKPQSSIAESTSHNMLRAPASKIHPGITHHSDPTCQTTPVWSNQPHVEFERLGDAMLALGPTILHVKKSTNKGKCITEYKCRFPNCKRRMRVVSPGDGPFSGPAYLTTLLACSHKEISWAEHYRTQLVKRHGRNIKLMSPKIGLHPLVRACTDILAMTRLQPKEISRKTQADFAIDPMFLQSCPVQDIITQQTISHRIRLIRHDGI